MLSACMPGAFRSSRSDLRFVRGTLVTPLTRCLIYAVRQKQKEEEGKGRKGIQQRGPATKTEFSIAPAAASFLFSGFQVGARTGAPAASSFGRGREQDLSAAKVTSAPPSAARNAP